MITFKSITVSNFMAFGQKPTSFPLDTAGTTLILGKNLDASVDTVSSNGAAKTSIIQAVVFALYGKGLDKLRADEFVNITNGKGLVVELTFTKGGHEYKISRRRKPSGLDLYIDGETHTLDSMANTDAMIQDIIGMPHEVFLMSFFLTPHNTSFMAMSGPEQRSLIESMLSLDVLAKRADSLKEIRKELEVDLKLAERDLQHAESTNQRIHANLSRLEASKEEWELSHQKKLKELVVALDELLAINLDDIKEEFSFKQEVAERLNEVVEEISQLTMEKVSQESLLRDAERSVSSIKSDIASHARLEASVDDWEATHRDKLYSIEKSLQALPDAYGDDVESLRSRLDEVSLRRENTQKISSMERDINRLVGEAEALDEKVKSLEEGKCHACGQSHFDEELVIKETARVNKILDEVDEMTNELEALEKATASLCTQEEGEAIRLKIRDIEGGVAARQKMEAEYAATKGLTNPHKEALESFGMDVEGMEEKLVETQEYAEKLSAKVADIEAKVNGLVEERDALKEKKFPLCEEFGIEVASQIDAIVSLREESEADLASHKEQTNPYVKEIEATGEDLVDISSVQDQCDELKKDITHCQYLVKLLTDNKSFVRKNIVDKYIPLVNKKIVEYTELLGLRHVPSINSDLSTDIEYMNKNVSFYNLSQGERLRTNLSVSLAFRHLMRSLGNDTNLLIIDEFFDAGGDAVFLSKAFFLVQDQAQSVMMVSHRDEFKEMVGNTVTVVKENGFSRIE